MARRSKEGVKELKALIKRVEREYGWTVTVTANNHLRWCDPRGNYRVSTSHSPSDRHAVDAIKRDLRREGLEV